MPIKGL
jgi:hypothetical protein